MGDGVGGDLRAGCDVPVIRNLLQNLPGAHRDFSQRVRVSEVCRWSLTTRGELRVDQDTAFVGGVDVSSFFCSHKIITDRPVGLSVLYLVFVLHKKRTKRKRKKLKAGMSGKMKENGGMDSGLWLFRGPAYVSSQRNKINIEISIHHLARKGVR